MSEIIAETESGKYIIYLERSALSQAGELALSLVKGRRAYIVTDKNVGGLYLAPIVADLEQKGFTVSYILLSPGESAKSNENLLRLYEEFFHGNIDRSDLIIALGGGVIGDLTGFAASTYMRGVKYLQIPTTLLSQVDSSVGGKTAINMWYAKNIVGAFYQPAAVIIDPDVLDTLPGEEFSAGMAEVIKYGCIKDYDLFNEIESNEYDIVSVIEKCVRIKADIVMADERDSGDRMLLNFGHTLGHAVEKVSGYGTFTHGEAISVGMVSAAKIGEIIGITKEGTRLKLKSVLEKHNLPVSADLPVEDIIDAVKGDKKNSSQSVFFVLLREIGESVLYPIEHNELGRLIAEVWGTV